MKAWNPRYVAYARAHQRGPEAMLQFDREQYLGGCMCGFIVWMSERWQEWRRLNGIGATASIWPAQQIEFDAWLDGAVSARLALVRLLVAVPARAGQLGLFAAR